MHGLKMWTESRREQIFTVDAGRLTSGGGKHVGQTLPGRHHLWVLLVCKVLPDAQRPVIWTETGDRRQV